MKTPEGYMSNAVGHLVPMESINQLDLIKHDLVMDIYEKAIEVSKHVHEFKMKAFDDINAFLDLAAQEYDVKMGGTKGNVRLQSYDGRYRIQIAIDEYISFDEKLQLAKDLIDECIHEWTKDSIPEIRTLIDSAFEVDKQGKINTKRVLGLRRLAIDHPQWKKAMDIISDSIQITGSKQYLRIYKRQDDGSYSLMPMDTGR